MSPLCVYVPAVRAIQEMKCKKRRGSLRAFFSSPVEVGQDAEMQLTGQLSTAS